MGSISSKSQLIFQEHVKITNMRRSSKTTFAKSTNSHPTSEQPKRKSKKRIMDVYYIYGLEDPDIKIERVQPDMVTQKDRKIITNKNYFYTNNVPSSSRLNDLSTSLSSYKTQSNDKLNSRAVPNDLSKVYIGFNKNQENISDANENSNSIFQSLKWEDKSLPYTSSKSSLASSVKKEPNKKFSIEKVSEHEATKSLLKTEGSNSTLSCQGAYIQTNFSNFISQVKPFHNVDEFKDVDVDELHDERETLPYGMRQHEFRIRYETALSEELDQIGDAVMTRLEVYTNSSSSDCASVMFQDLNTNVSKDCIQDSELILLSQQSIVTESDINIISKHCSNT